MAAQIRLKHCFLLFVLAMISQIAGGLLLGAPAHPDAGLSAGNTFGAFLMFTFWFLSLLAWGQALRQILCLEKFGTLASLALGSLGAAIAVMFLGHVGLIGPENQMLLRVLTFAGHIVNFIVIKRMPTATLTTHQPLTTSKGLPSSFLSLRPEHFAYVALFIIGASCLLNNAFPIRGSDEYYYHLLGPKLWSDAGRIALNTHHPSIMQCSLWEYLYLWGFSFLTETGPFGLVEAQLFARWTHVAIGFAGCGLALHQIIGRYTDSKTWRAVILVVAMLSPALTFSTLQAKNDWGAAFWTLTAMVLLFDRGTVLKKQLVVGGFFLGAAIVAKLSVMLTAIPLVAIWMVSEVFLNKQQPRRLTAVALVFAGVVLATTPILLRNWIEVENPIFPAFNSYFKSPWASTSWQNLQNKFEAKGFELSTYSWSKKTAALFKSCPWILALAALPFLRSWSKLIPLLAIGIGSFFLLNLKVDIAFGEVSHFLRMQGPGALLLTTVCLLLLEKIASKFGSRASALLAGAALLLSLKNPEIPWNIWRDAFKLPPSQLILRDLHLGGAAKTWLRLNAKQDDVIFSTGDAHIYYISHLNVVVMTNQPDIDAQTMRPLGPRDILEVLRNYNGRYLLDTRHWHTYAWGVKAERLQRMLLNHPESLAFASKGGDIYDLVRLEEEVFKSCVHRKAPDSIVQGTL